MSFWRDTDNYNGRLPFQFYWVQTSPTLVRGLMPGFDTKEYAIRGPNYDVRQVSKCARASRLEVTLITGVLVK